MNPRASLGFTITELMITVLVVGILASLAVPGFRSLIQGQQAKNASFELFASLALARSEAIKRNGNVTLTPTNTGNWGLGWTITSAGGESIRTQQAIKGVVISASGAPATVVYSRSGRAATAAAFNVDVSATATSNIRCIKTELSGMPRTIKGACS